MTITVRCVGHIRTSLRAEELEMEGGPMRAVELIERLRESGASDPRLGFTKFNTLVIVNGGEAFTAAADDRELQDGDVVTLVPFSHGG